jgi:TOTE conflict system, Archaeo-Eukaryotic Primase domain/Type III restriction enzyme, res subunit
VPAAQARKLGTHILTETMERCPEIGFESYDRFFPSQDTMPAGGFGNLIALPLQRNPREQGNSVFVDERFQPYADQWRFMSSIKRMSLMDVSILVDEAERRGQVLGVRLPIDDDDEEPWLLPPSRRKLEMPLDSPAPQNIELVLADQIYIARRDLPASLVNRLIRLAAFQNPEFYKAQAMRLPTFGKPRIISCAELSSKHVALPRGCLDQTEALLASLGVKIHFRDERSLGVGLNVRFLGELTTEQGAARDALLRHETGVLAAATAFGKTVVAASMIAERGRNSLILVHRQQLLDQWIARLATFLDKPASDIGQIGGGKKRPTGKIDVALIQSLVRKGEVDDIVANYGYLVVDECHHLPAVSFEAVARRCKAKYVLGLSATVTRRDGHHPVIFMQCGPVRFRVDARERAAARPFRHIVLVRHTGFNPPAGVTVERPAIQEIYAALCRDIRRNDLIFDDVLRALEARRSPVILTERTEHAQLLAERLSRFRP